MSKLFFDHIIVLDEVEDEIKAIGKTSEERDELWKLVDEIVHHKVLDTTLEHLPRKHHEEFLEKFHLAPHDEGLIHYLTEKIGKNVEEIIKQEIGNLAYELLETIKGKSK